MDDGPGASLGRLKQRFPRVWDPLSGVRLVPGLAGWDDACMSENKHSGAEGTSPGGEEDRVQGLAKENPKKPITQPMHTVGQRRRESEKKLENHQRESRTRPSD